LEVGGAALRGVAAGQLERGQIARVELESHRPASHIAKRDIPRARAAWSGQKAVALRHHAQPAVERIALHDRGRPERAAQAPLSRRGARRDGRPPPLAQAHVVCGVLDGTGRRSARGAAGAPLVAGHGDANRRDQYACDQRAGKYPP
jgi:hypothetical protein